jgi:hypothetical protein
VSFRGKILNEVKNKGRNVKEKGRKKKVERKSYGKNGS